MNLFDTVKGIDAISKGVSIFSQASNIYDYFTNPPKEFKQDPLIQELNKYKSYSRMNQYKFILTPPMYLTQGSNILDAMDIYGTGVSVPSTSLSQKVVRQGMDRISTSGVIDTDTFTITFQDTENNFFHSFFTVWQHSRKSDNGAIAFYPDDFNGEASVFRKFNDQQESFRQVYSMEKIYPIGVSDLRFDENEIDSLQTFDVTFFTNRLKLFKKDF